MRTSESAMILVAVWILAAVAPIPACIAAYLESDTEVPAGGDGEEPARPWRVIPPPEGENPLKTLIRSVDVGAPMGYRHMMVYPLLTRSAPGSSGIRTLDRALANGWITIREKDNAEVSSLLVRNDSRHHVFLMGGEIVAGGRQNRIVRDDVLLAPRSGFVSVPVYCGEKERWTESEEKFRTEKGLADQGIRKRAARSEPQGAIWREIDARMRETDVKSETRDYRQIYRDERVNREAAGCVSHYRRFCGSRTVGAVVVIGGRIVSCDLFSDPDLVSALWDKLCRSYSVDMAGARYGEAGKGRTISREAIRSFLDGALSARYSGEHTAGEGWRMRISGDVEGAVLNLRDSVVHAAIFPGTPHIFRGTEEPEPVPFEDGPRHGDGKIWR